MFKIKGGRLIAKPRTTRHRGQRLIKADSGITRTFIQCRGGCCSRLIEVQGPDQHFKMTYSPSGTHAIAKGHDAGDPAQFLIDTEGQMVALRESDDEGGHSPIPRTTAGSWWPSTASGSATRRWWPAPWSPSWTTTLARWPGCSPLLCKLDDIQSMHDNPRLKRVLHFDFDVAIAGPVPTGPRAEDAVRHHHSPWEAMLREAGRDVGGILFPKEYDALRTGADRLVRGALKHAAGKTP